jgi:hypothetical protein
MITKGAMIFLIGIGTIGLVGSTVLARPEKATKPPEAVPQHSQEWAEKVVEVKTKQRPDLGRGFLLIIDANTKPQRYKTLVECQAAQAAKGAGVCVNGR